MSIDMTCFSKLTPEELEPVLERIRSENSSIFPEEYILYKARELDCGDEEFAAEFGLYGVKSYAFISMVGGVDRESMPKDIADLMRKYLGEENALILLLGETKI